MLGYETPSEEISNQASGRTEGTSHTRFPIVLRMWGKLVALSSVLDAKLPFSVTLQTLAFLIVMTWFALFLPLRSSSINDYDLGWHLRSGEWIMQHHELPKTDPFSITGGSAPWVAYSWPFSVLIYELAKNFDFQGIAAYSTLVWFATVILIFAMARGQGASFWRAIGLTFIAGNVFPRVISPRPGTITILLFILLLDILLRERKKGYGRITWVVPLIIWAWSNIHVQFVYGLFILGVFCIEPVLDWLFLKDGEREKWSGRLWAVLTVSIASTLLNPYGFGSYQVLLDFVRQPLLAGFVIETSAMPFTMHIHYIVLLLTLGAIYGLARRKPIRPLWVVLLLWAACSAFRMERDIWLITTVAIAFLATPLPDADPEPRVSSRVWIYGTVGILLAIFLSIRILPSNKFMMGLLAIELPVGAVAYAHEHHLSGPLFNDYDWGGFLIYALPEIPVAMDGRTNVHGQDEVGRSINTWLMRPGWDRDPLLNNANLIIGTPKKALTNYLRLDPHFKMVFDDGVAVVFQRIKPGRPGLVESPENTPQKKH
jgi:hypothetical protein